MGSLHSLLSNVTQSTEGVVPTVDNATLLYSSQVEMLMWEGNSALNPACSLWQHYLWAVVMNTFLGMPNVLSSKVKKLSVVKTNTLPGSDFCLKPILTQKKNEVFHLHFHWLPGPKSKHTRPTERFAPIKHSMRAFKGFTFSHRWFCTVDLYVMNHYIPSFAT